MSLVLQIDSREQKFAHITKPFDREGVEWFVSKLPCGAYQSLDNARLCIDRKQNCEELCVNLTQQHTRFRNELNRAVDLGIQLIFLVEHGPDITTLGDVRNWVNPRLKRSPLALSGMDLYKRLRTIEIKYQTEFFFCNKEDTGARIIQLLSQNITKSNIERR